MTTVAETVDERLARLVDRRGELEQRRDELAADLQQLEADFDATVIDGGDPNDLHERRRRLLGDVEATDRAMAALTRPIEAARQEIAEREARARLAELRERIPQAEAEARERAERLGPAIDALAEQVADAARQAAVLIARSVRDGADLAALHQDEHTLSVQCGQTPRYEDRRHEFVSAGQRIIDHTGPLRHVDVGAGIPERVGQQRLLYAAARGPADVLTELAEVAKRYIDGTR